MKNTHSILLLLLILFVGTSSIAQESNKIHWTKVLENNRAEGLKEIERVHSSENSIESLLSKEIIRYENGMFQTPANFVQDFLKMQEREYYLYALWNESYFFSDYLSSGFNNKNVANIDAFYAAQTSNRTVRDAILYLKGIRERHTNNFPAYEKYVGEVKGIREWQFCGVFENLNNSGIDANYPPEIEAQSTSGFNANSNGVINWYVPPRNVEAWQMMTNHSEYGSGVHYAQTFINAPSEREVYIRVGCSSRFKLWLNDVLIYENGKDQTTDLDAYVVKVKMPKGNNRLLLKLAEQNNAAFFIVRLTDKDNNIQADLTTTSAYSAYNTSTVESVDPVLVENEFEQFFEAKVKADPGNFLNTYCLIKTYLRSEKYELAMDVLEPWLEKYPKSSILRVLALNISGLDDDNNRVKELRENIKNDDPKYHIALLMQFSDVGELFRMSQGDMEKVLDDYAASVDDKTIKYATEMIKMIRVDDKKGVKKNLDKLMELSLANGNLHSMKSFGSLYEAIFNDAEKTHALDLQINKKYFDTEVRDRIVSHLDSKGSKAKAKKILEENIKFLPNEGPFLKDMINYMHYTEDYKGSLVYINKWMDIFPYSFVGMEMKGDALLQTGDVAGALEWYKRSLVHNSANSDLRKKIRDINNEKDWVEEHRTKDIYKFIKENKGKITENNFGYNILLDEVVVQLYHEAGGKTRVTYVYEITSEAGVEKLKEYNLGLSGNYKIIKSEIVKKNGKIVPAEKSGSSFVFNGLEVGDFIHIDYQSNFNGYGRFYRDMIDEYQFTSTNPILFERYTLLAPKDLDVQYAVKNGELEFERADNDDFNIYKWTLRDHSGMPAGEKYMPHNVDVHTTLHLSSIKSWSDIANWYSDLVRQQIEINSVVKKAFNEIFPNGVDGLTDYQKAEKIYNYIANNMTYSFVPFKQSGFVPQKPSKTITTKMGDCKDLSTLFVTLGDMAGLKANLVLVSTSDNGRNQLVLPSQGFNHCIVHVELGGKGQFLELTDKNLPFLALPNSDLNAQILQIPRKYEAEAKYELSYLKEPRRLRNTYSNKVKMVVNADEKKFTIDTEISGAGKSYTADIFDNKSYTIIKKKMHGRFRNNVGENCTLDSLYNMMNEREKNAVSYTAEVTLKEKTNKIGKYNVIKLPYIVSAYTASIISEEKRDYPINYQEYEDVDEYKTVYDVHIKAGEVFTEIPENVELKYKEHSYIHKYEKIAPNHLRVTVIAKPSVKDITVEEYEEFKKYVNKVLEARDEMIAYQ